MGDKIDISVNIECTMVCLRVKMKMGFARCTEISEISHVTREIDNNKKRTGDFGYDRGTWDKLERNGKISSLPFLLVLVLIRAKQGH